MRPVLAVLLASAGLLVFAACDEIVGINQHVLAGEGGIGLDGGVIVLDSGGSPGELDASTIPELD